jgi:hypothetical protein
MADCPSRFTLALRRAGDLGPAEAEAIDAHLAGCAPCRAAVAEIEAARADYAGRTAAAYGDLLEAISREPVPIRAARSRRRAAVGAAVSLAGLAAAAAVALAIFEPWGRGQRGDAIDAPAVYAGLKGGVAFRVVARRGARQFAVREDDALRAGDALRFVVTSPAAGYLAVMCVESSGRVSAFYPAEGEAWPLRVGAPGRAELPGSIILDEAPGDEVYAVLFSRRPFARGEALAAAARLAGGTAPAGFDSGALRVRKAAATE